MQLLDSEQLEFAFRAQGITLEGEARAFYANLWNIIKSAEKIRDPLELNDCASALRKTCHSYFARSNEWLRGEQDLHEMRPSCAHSQQNAREAETYLPVFEKEFFRYALCYMELNRALIQKRAFLAHFAKDYNINDAALKLDVNNSTGILLARAHKEREQIVEKRQRMERIKEILLQFDHPLETLGRGLPELYGQMEGDHQLTLFKGALRQREFAKARLVCGAWNSPYLADTARVIVDLAEKHAEALNVKERLLLHSGELSLISAFIAGDEARMNQFMEKFNIPYMVFQYRNLMRQGYLLGRIGSIEGLIIHHAKVTALAARCHADNILAQQQESAVLVPARQLFDQQFKQLGAIFSDMETTCAILEKLFSQTRDYMRSTP